MNKTLKPSCLESGLGQDSSALQDCLQNTSAVRFVPARRALLRGAGAGLLGTLNLALLGCGGGGEADTAARTTAGTAAATANPDGVKFAMGGIDGGGTGASADFFISAAIDSTAPLTVNGITIDTTGSAIVDADGNPLGLQQLQPGMGCQIEARLPRAGAAPTGATLQALAIRSTDQLTAAVQTVDRAGSTLVALGQRVVVTAQTAFGHSLLTGLAAVQPGAVLRVWGQLDLTGQRIVATRIENAASDGAAATFSLRGAISALDRGTGHLAIGTWHTTATTGVQIADDLQVGDVVRVRLAVDGQTLLSVANDALKLPDHVQAEVEGRVTRVDTAQRFAVDGVEVNAAGATGLPSATLLRPGQQVAVRGRWNNGSLQASSVKVEADEPVELQGTIAAADYPQRRFKLKGVTVVWSSSTRFEGGSARLLTPRRRVAVLGRWSADGLQLEALHIHVEG